MLYVDVVKEEEGRESSAQPTVKKTNFLNQKNLNITIIYIDKSVTLSDRFPPVFPILGLEIEVQIIS